MTGRTPAQGFRWLGHAGVLLDGPPAVYVDPWRIAGRKGLPAASLVLITHGHFDHASLEDVAFVAGPGTVVAGPEAALAGLAGIHRPLRPGDVLDHGGVRVTAFAAGDGEDGFHPPSAGLAFLVETAGLRFFHAGDTSLPLPDLDPVPDVIALPVCGGTVFDAAAAAAEVLRLGPSSTLPLHWGELQGGWTDADRFRAAVHAGAPGITVVLAEPPPAGRGENRTRE